jgi:cold shock CspA family protein
VGSLFGWVVHFSAERRFGKIRGDRQEFFVHRDDLVDVLTLTPGQRVQFQVVKDERGPRASAVMERMSQPRSLTNSRQRKWARMRLTSEGQQ